MIKKLERKAVAMKVLLLLFISLLSTASALFSGGCQDRCGFGRKVYHGEPGSMECVDSCAVIASIWLRLGYECGECATKPSTVAPSMTPPVDHGSCSTGSDGLSEVLTLRAAEYDGWSGVGVVPVRSESTEEFPDAVGYIKDGDWILFQQLEFSSCMRQVQVRVSGNFDGGIIEIRIDNVTGDLLGQCLVLPTGGFDKWQTRYCTIFPTVETHDVYLVFRKGSPDQNSYMLDLQWIKFLSEPFRKTGNPIIRHMRTADPSARVWNDGKVWLYASHDQDLATDYDTMDGYHVFSSSNLRDWTDHGEVLHSRDVSWGISGGGFMWAPDCVFYKGVYYFYYPHKDKNEDWRIGVAWSQQPQGPFTDIGNYIEGTGGIDPCVFIDDDGQAYLYFGHKTVAKLKDNMIELAESPRQIDIGPYSGFSEGKFSSSQERCYCGGSSDLYSSFTTQKGPWMHKRNGMYYFSYTWLEGPDGQSYYGVGDSPYGPFEFKGALAKPPAGAQDHHSIVEYQGNWYYFYHVGGPGPNPWHRRMVAVDYLYYNADGTMKFVNETQEGVDILHAGTMARLASSSPVPISPAPSSSISKSPTPSSPRTFESTPPTPSSLTPSGSKLLTSTPLLVISLLAVLLP
jgi:hypothetical protein